MIRIAIVDDDPLVRTGLAMLFEPVDDMVCVGEAEDGEEAVVLARREQIDVMLLDVRMPVMDGIEAARQISTQPDAPKILILTTFENDGYVFEALRAGASGFLLKRTPPDDLIAGIREVHEGNGLLSPSVTRTLIETFAALPQQSEASAAELGGPLELLTERETEILRAMARGLTNDEIAAAHHIAQSTVKTHVKRILMKLGARNRSQAVIAAYENGLMDRSG